MIDFAYLNAQIERVGTDEAAEDAFHNLIELGPNYLPAIIERFEAETVSCIRLALIRVIWEYRSPLSVPTLLAALEDAYDEIVLAALDGLVTIGGEVAIIGMQKVASTLPNGSARKAWIEEALEETEGANETINSKSP